MKIGANQPVPRPAPTPADDATTARLVEAAPDADAAWAILGGGGKAMHVRSLTAGMDPADADRIGGAVAKGLAMLAAHTGPVPASWVARMLELHTDALERLWAVDGQPTQVRVFQVLGAIPTRLPVDWLERGIDRLDKARGEDAREEAGLALVERAVTAWLRHETEGRR